MQKQDVTLTMQVTHGSELDTLLTKQKRTDSQLESLLQKPVNATKKVVAYCSCGKFKSGENPFYCKETVKLAVPGDHDPSTNDKFIASYLDDSND